MENQLDVPNHEKTTHETDHTHDFSRDKESRHVKGTTPKNRHEDTFREQKGRYDRIMGRQGMKPNPKTIFRETKNRYERDKNP